MRLFFLSAWEVEMRGTTKSRIAGIFSLLVVFAVGGCSGYQLKIDEAEVLSQDDTSITYRVTVKNAPPGRFRLPGEVLPR